MSGAVVSAAPPARPTLRFVVEGPPVGKERARVTAHGTFTPEKTARYESLVRSLARLSTPPGWTLGGQYALTCRVFYGDRRRRDLDNCVKCIGDGLNKSAYTDDSQVAELHAYRGYDKARPRVEVELMLLEGAPEGALPKSTSVRRSRNRTGRT